METLTLLATAPAILALVNLAKSFGVAGRWSAALAVVLGVGLSVTDGLYGAEPLYGWIAGGLLLGLGVSGLYDLATLVSGKSAQPSDLEHVVVLPADPEPAGYDVEDEDAADLAGYEPQRAAN